MSKFQLQTLFQKIGGEKKVKEILHDFYHRMADDVLIGYFFAGKQIDSIADRQSEFLLFATGIRSSYGGKTPTSAHLELPPILAGHFDRRLTLLRQTLKDHGLDEKDIQIWVGFENAFRNVIQK